MRTFLLLMVLWAPLALAQPEIFHGWSKDGSYLVYQASGNNDVTELFFCPTDSTVNPSWPAALNDLDRTDERALTCVRFIDPNKAPYQWKNALVLPAPANAGKGLEVLPELVTDGETPGFVISNGDKKQNCYVSGIREESKLQKVWWHPNSKWVAAQIDNKFHHCQVQLKPGKTAPPAKGGGKKK